MENETTKQTSNGVAAWKIMLPAIVVMMVVQGLNELSWVRASGRVTTISVSVLSLSVILLVFFSFRAQRELRRIVASILCGLGIVVIGMLLGKLLSTPICFAAGYVSGFFQGFWNA